MYEWDDAVSWAKGRTSAPVFSTSEYVATVPAAKAKPVMPVAVEIVPKKALAKRAKPTKPKGKQ
jgi:hypothetical protein